MARHLTAKRLKEFAEVYNKYGKEHTNAHFNFKHPETISRYLRYCRQDGIEINLPPAQSIQVAAPSSQDKLVTKILEKFSKTELELILKDHQFKPHDIIGTELNFNKECITFGVLSDTHIGHVCFKANHVKKASEEFKRSNVDFVVHAGDVTEGMSHRPGHVYELTHIGYENQKQYAIDIFKTYFSETPIYFIDGNHDRWFIKSSGALIVKDICENLPNATYLGHDEGSIFTNGIEIRLWHGEDGASYAKSYRLQKIIESLAENDKPSILIAGHDHKSMMMPNEQGVITIAAGTLESQTKWMRGKRISAAVGFWTIKLWVDGGKIVSCDARWFRLE